MSAIPDDVVRDDRMTFADARKMVTLDCVFGNITAEKAAAMLSLLDKDEKDHEHPPGIAALEALGEERCA